MKIPIIISHANLSDLPEIDAIQTESISAEKKISAHIFEESIRNFTGTFLVARDDHQALAYILGSHQSIPQKSIEILEIAILPSHHRQGLGTLLLAALKQATVELNIKSLHVSCPDDLLSYFEMNGFAELESIDSQYGTNSGFNLVWMNPFYEDSV